METLNIFFALPALCGIIFAAAGVFMLVFPPKKINSFYGYRTIASMKSDAHWHFAQKYSSVRLILVGLVLFALSTLKLLVDIGENPQLYIGIALTLLAVFYILSATEKALKAKFPNT